METQVGSKAAVNRERSSNRPFSHSDLPMAVVILMVGIILAGLVITTRALAVVLAAGLFLVLPWLLKSPIRFYIWLIITWPVLTLYARTSSTGQLPNITYERLLVPLLVVILLIEGLAFRKKLPQISLFIWGYLAAQILTRLALFFLGGTGIPDVVYLLNSVILPITMYWVTKALLTSPVRIRYLLYALIVVSIITCLSGMYERAIDAQVSPFPIGVYSTLGQSRWLDVPGGRAAGIAANPAVFGGIMGLGILAGVCLLMHTEKRIQRYLLGAASLFLLYGVFISFTRAAWLAVAGVLFLLQFKFGKLWRYTLPFFILGGVAALFLLVDFGNTRVIQDRILNPTTINARLEMARVALTEFVQRPVLGWGPEAYNQFIFDFVHGATQSFGASSSHNTYFTLLVDGGLLLLLSFALMIAAFFWKGFHAILAHLPNSFERSVTWGMLGSVMIFLLLGLTNDLRDFIYYNVLLFVALGVIENVLTMGTDTPETSPVERRTLV